MYSVVHMCDIECISLPRSKEMEGGCQGLGEQEWGMTTTGCWELILACVVMAM